MCSVFTSVVLSTCRMTVKPPQEFKDIFYSVSVTFPTLRETFPVWRAEVPWDVMGQARVSKSNRPMSGTWSLWSELHLPRNRWVSSSNSTCCLLLRRTSCSVTVQHLSLSIQAAASARLFAVMENRTAMMSLTKISVKVSTDEKTSVPPSCRFLELSEAHRGEQHIESSQILVVKVNVQWKSYEQFISSSDDG